MSDVSLTTLRIVPPVGPNQYNATAGAGVAAGTPCYQAAGSADNVATPARANTNATSSVAGLAVNGFAEGDPCRIQYAGPLTLTEDQWDAATGDTGGLTRGSVYYLSADAAGKLTSTAPVPTNNVTQVGIALSSTTLLIQLSATIEQSS